MKKGDGRVLCYGGQAAAAAAKFGRPLDFKCIAARVDAGGWGCGSRAEVVLAPHACLGACAH